MLKKKFNGTVEITLNNRVNTRKLQLVNGHGEFDYTNTDYFPGNYTALAKYEGNDFLTFTTLVQDMKYFLKSNLNE